jgi:hypothetical protein
MIILLSPAKIQHFSDELSYKEYSLPVFLKEAEKLVRRMRSLSAQELARLLGINRELTRLTLDRYLQWQRPFTPGNARQAALVFDGEVFRGLQASTFTPDDFATAQSCLRILSGLYGVLRPLDLIQPYRLEVSSKLANEAGRDLYPFWTAKVNKLLREELKSHRKSPFILNLASTEYFKMTGFKKDDVPVIDVEFYEYKHDNFRQVVIYTKKARGMMARYVITRKIDTFDDLKGFDSDGYWYNPNLSSESKLVFVR